MRSERANRPGETGNRQCGRAVWRLGLLPVSLCLVLTGCQQLNRATGSVAVKTGGEAGTGMTPSNESKADVRIDLGRVMEKRGENEQAMAAYQEALKEDPKRADAMRRLAALYDRQGKFAESEALYRKALALTPNDADLHNSMGYSYYVQSRFTEAERSLRQAIVLNPDHQKAHVNLGLVLAHADRVDEALTEFRKGGCDESDAHINLAYALTLERCWPEARQQYEYALAAKPSSAPAKKGLEELNALVAKAESPGGTRPRGNPAIVPIDQRSPPADAPQAAAKSEVKEEGTLER
jgi:tetratricopeptide (TPR) repeat protein